ncbi:MAG: phospholipase A [Bdellovibrionales bacterium]
MAMRLLTAAILIFTIPQIAFAETEAYPSLSEAKDKADAIDKDETDILQRHQPFYFAYGHELSKLQVSFKTPLVRTWQLYFGYTQLMFWALNRDSKPFHDLTFNPELFYTYHLDNRPLLKSIDFGFLNHNSNGKDGPESRSFNKSYVRFNFEKELKHWVARLSIQAQDIYNFDPGNANIQDYVGPLAFNMTFIQLFDGWLDKSEISLAALPGGKFANGWDHGGYQLSWSFRLGGLKIVPAFYLQYYRGFAETLINYNERVDVFRGGVIF